MSMACPCIWNAEDGPSVGIHASQGKEQSMEQMGRWTQTFSCCTACVSEPLHFFLGIDIWEVVDILGIQCSLPNPMGQATLGPRNCQRPSCHGKEFCLPVCSSVAKGHSENSQIPQMGLNDLQKPLPILGYSRFGGEKHLDLHNCSFLSI